MIDGGRGTSYILYILYMYVVKTTAKNTLGNCCLKNVYLVESSMINLMGFGRRIDPVSVINIDCLNNVCFRFTNLIQVVMGRGGRKLRLLRKKIS